MDGVNSKDKRSIKKSNGIYPKSINKCGINFCVTNFCGLCSHPQKLVPQNSFKMNNPQKLVIKYFSINLFFKTQHASESVKALDAGKLREVPLRLS